MQTPETDEAFDAYFGISREGEEENDEEENDALVLLRFDATVDGKKYLVRLTQTRATGGFVCKYL